MPATFALGQISLGRPGQPLFVAAFVAICAALWMARRLLPPLVPVLAGPGAGLAVGIWLAAVAGWHPLLAVMAVLIALAVCAAVFRVLTNVFLARLGFAVIAMPAGMLALARLAFPVFGGWWAWAIMLIGTWSLATMLKSFAMRENGATWQWFTNLIDDLRGE